MTTRDLDLFAAGGGWDQGIKDLGIRPVGVEWKREPCETARAAGHFRVQADIAALDPIEFATSMFGSPEIDGGIASPPCQGWSSAGNGYGHYDAVRLLTAVPHMLDRDVRSELRNHMFDARSVLALEPLRWAIALRPKWLAWEQVPGVLPLWEECAKVLRLLGYSAATGNLRAEQYGVPQQRRRAVLVARSPELTVTLGPARLPEPTHSMFRPNGELDDGVKPWVTIGEALALDDNRVQRSNYSGSSSYQGQTAQERGRTLRTLDQPSVTITSKGFQWTEAGDPADARRTQATVSEVARLQTFPADYPWQGKLGEQKQQIGDAVPPLLAAAIVAEIAPATVAQEGV